MVLGPDKLTNLFMDAPMGIVILKGEDHLVDFMNNEAVKLSVSKSYLGKPFENVFGDYSELADTIKFFNLAYSKNKPYSTFESSMTRDWSNTGVATPRYFNRTIQPTLDSKDSPNGLIVFLIDITEQVLARSALEKQHKWLETVLNSIPTPISFMAPETGEILFSNDAADKITGRSFPVEDPLLFRAAQGEKIEGGTMVWDSPEGKKSLLFNAETILSKYGQPTTVVCSFQDVSLLKKIEGQLQDALKVRDQFLAIASHELKTPLTSIGLQIQFAKRGVKSEKGLLSSPEKLLEIFERCDRQIKRLTNLTEILLDVSKIQNGKLSLYVTRVYLREVIDEIVGQLKEGLIQAHSKIDIQCDPHLQGQWDSSRLGQVFENLMSNALKYAPGSTIRILVEGTKDSVFITFSDDGIGISKKDQAKIFERFERATTAHYISGMGVGLFVVKELILAHGGTIDIESDVGLGAKFNIKLPINFLKLSEQD